MSSAVLRRLATTCRSVPTFSYGRSFSTSSSLLADSNSNANAEGGVQTVTLIPGRISIGICLHDLVFFNQVMVLAQKLRTVFKRSLKLQVLRSIGNLLMLHQSKLYALISFLFIL